jgi:hypothetical protein
MLVGRTNRREFIAALGGAAAWPLVARAQQPPTTVRRVGALLGYQGGDELAQARIATFRRGLQQLGWAEGRNIQIEYRFTGVDSDRIQRAANDLVGWAPDVVLATPAQVALSLQKVAGDIPIVFANVQGTEPRHQGIQHRRMAQAWPRPRLRHGHRPRLRNPRLLRATSIASSPSAAFGQTCARPANFRLLG